MEDFLTCPVCFEYYEEKLHKPLVLACGHSLCRPCAVKISKDSLVCPLDRVVDLREIGAIPENRFILQMASHKHAKTAFPFRVHGNRELTHYCFGCGEGMCTGCFHTHSRHLWIDVRYDEGIRDKLREPQDQFMRKIQETYETYTEIYHTQLQRKVESEQEWIGEIKEKFGGIRYLLDRKEEEIIEAAAEATRKERKDLEEKYIKALNVLQHKEFAYRDMERLSGCVGRDLNDKIKIINSIDRAMHAAKNRGIVPLEEIIQEFQIDVEGITGVKNNIEKIYLQHLEQPKSDIITKRRKLDD